MSESIPFGTMCSGIGAPEVALGLGLGWRPVFFSEIEPFPSSVLAHHWPAVPNLGDFTLVDSEWLDRVRVLVAGTPCQAFSLAGKRLSLNDVRGNLTLSFVDKVHAARFLFAALWENVPGVLSTKDNAFGCFLGGLVGADAPLLPQDREWGAMPFFDSRSYDVHRTFGWKRCRWTDSGMVAGPLGRAAWRILDAQHFGLAQRRKRVFLVFCPIASGGDPSAILFERKSLQGYIAPRPKKREGVAGTISARTEGGGGLGTDFDLDGGLQIVPTLDASFGRLQGCSGQDSRHGHGHLITAFGGNNTAGPIDVSTALNAHAVPHGRLDFESETFVVHGTQDPCVSDHTAFALGRNNGGENCVLSVAYGLSRDAISRSDDPSISAENRAGLGVTEEISPTLKATGPCAVAFALRGREGGAQAELEGNQVGALRAAQGGASRSFVAGGPSGSGYAGGVRRLTPIECARLQGFPDRHTEIAYRGKLAPDGHQYRAYGNSMAVPVIKWLGERIAANIKQGRE